MNALVYAQVFNDERDIILSKWNQLQAFYGTGKIFFQNQVIDVKEDNPLTRFKVFRFLKTWLEIFIYIKLFYRLSAIAANPHIRMKTV